MSIWLSPGFSRPVLGESNTTFAAAGGNGRRFNLEGAPVLPRDLAEATAMFAGSELAASGFGPDVCDDLVALARQELDVARREVTDRDRARYFEVA